MAIISLLFIDGEDGEIDIELGCEQLEADETENTPAHELAKLAVVLLAEHLEKMDQKVVDITDLDVDRIN